MQKTRRRENSCKYFSDCNVSVFTKIFNQKMRNHHFFQLVVTNSNVVIIVPVNQTGWRGKEVLSLDGFLVQHSFPEPIFLFPVTSALSLGSEKVHNHCYLNVHSNFIYNVSKLNVLNTYQLVDGLKKMYYIQTNVYYISESEEQTIDALE